jgi:hypothetical protein
MTAAPVLTCPAGCTSTLTRRPRISCGRWSGRTWPARSAGDHDPSPLNRSKELASYCEQCAPGLPPGSRAPRTGSRSGHLAPAMAWDEREARDLHGITFTGHQPLRPLADRTAPLADWTVPVRGHDPYQVAVGPVHAGVIESGHFRFHVVGDRILHLDARLFYKHRGLERAAEGMPLAPALAVVSRACAACAVANGVAYATAAEQALGLRVAPQLGRPARCCWSWSGPGITSTTSPPSAPGWAWPPATPGSSP